LALVLVVAAPTPAPPQDAPHPRAILLDPAATGYTPVLRGPPSTVAVRSGYVVLAPGTAVGRHSTERYEEVVVVLAGTGQLRLAAGDTLALREGTVAYSPPDTEHDVVNTGTTPLRYLYVVAPTR
jgi:quercetin dioxygenase-like cupin family protein